MRKLICLILLAAFVSAICGKVLAQKPSQEIARHKASPFPQSEVEIKVAETWPETPLLAGLKAEIGKQWLQQGKFWFSRETSDGTIRQVGDVSCRLQPMQLTSPDRLNGIEWRGVVSFSWKAERFYLPGEEKWTHWKEGDRLMFRVTVEGGKPDFEVASAPLNPLTRKRSELGKPEADQVKALLDKPKMTAAESGNVFLAKPSGGSVAGPGDRRPVMLSMPSPEYSAKGRAQKITGTVVMSVEVLPNGTVGRISVVKSLGYGLDEKATETVRKGRFLPALKDGKPVAATARIEVTFNIH